jgi:hypothetical protein
MFAEPGQRRLHVLQHRLAPDLDLDGIVGGCGRVVVAGALGGQVEQRTIEEGGLSIGSTAMPSGSADSLAARGRIPGAAWTGTTGATQDRIPGARDGITEATK